MSDETSAAPVPPTLSIFQLVRLASLRAKQLQAGARPRVEPNGDKLLRIALREVLAGLVSWSVSEPPQKVPIETTVKP